MNHIDNTKSRAASASPDLPPGAIRVESERIRNLANGVYEELGLLEIRLAGILATEDEKKEGVGLRGASTCDFHDELIATGNIVDSSYRRLCSMIDRIQI